jgi:hypothetical protein
MGSIFASVLLPILLRYAVTAVGSGAAAIAGHLISQYGLSTGTVAGLGGGVVAAGAALVTALNRNRSASAIINRIPVVDMLHAVANATHADVKEIQVGSAALADSVPSPKVVPAEGHTQSQP